MILGILLGFVVDDQILKDTRKVSHVHDYSGLSAGKKVFQALIHAVDEFFDTGRYLIFGSLVPKYVDLPTYPYSYDNRAQFGDSHPSS